MKTIQLTYPLKQGAFRFRRFSRAAYAAFASMHKQVTIGTLKGATADAQMRKDAAEELRLSLSNDANHTDCNGAENDDVATGNMSIIDVQNEAFAAAVVAFSTNVAAASATANPYICTKKISKRRAGHFKKLSCTSFLYAIINQQDKLQ